LQADNQRLCTQKVVSDAAVQKIQEEMIKRQQDTQEEKTQLQSNLQSLRDKKIQLEQEVGSLHSKMAQLQQTNTRLEEEISNLKSKSDLYSKVVNNVQEMVTNLPATSPFHRPILRHATKGLTTKDAKEVFPVSTKTLRRAQHDNWDPFMSIKVRKVKRQRVAQERITKSKEIINDLLPIASGRSYRVQTKTTKQLYAEYVQQAKATNVKAVSPFYFRALLSKEYIRHSNNNTLCPLCFQLPYYASLPHPLAQSDQKMLDKLEQHKTLFTEQLRTYLEQKKQLASGTLGTSTCLVVQDFTQLTGQTMFVQDLILTLTHTTLEAQI
jgi:hypothetical protein